MGGERPGQPWTSILDPERRALALDIARDVALRSTNTNQLAQALAAASGQTHYPRSLQWQPHGIGQGDAGIAVLCAYFDRWMPDSGWDVAGDGFLSHGISGAHRPATLPLGLFSGVTGLAFAAASLSRDGTRYQRLLTSLDEEIAPRASALGAELQDMQRQGAVNTFDVISGASGVGAYLLVRDPGRALPGVIAGLVALTLPRGSTPRWATPADALADESMARIYPLGNLNCGLAHGIPGPLALLSLALIAGVQVPGQVEAVRFLADWLLDHRVDDEWGINWASAVPLGEPRAPVADQDDLLPARAAWCYGSPGVARALWIAGTAIGDTHLLEAATEAMRSVLRRPVERRNIESPTFCHGTAGLLQVCLRFAHDTGSEEITAGAVELVDSLLAAYEPSRPLAYASLEPGSTSVDRAGLLDGAPGVAMVLLAAASDHEPTWDRLFMLS